MEHARVRQHPFGVSAPAVHQHRDRPAALAAGDPPAVQPLAVRRGDPHVGVVQPERRRRPAGLGPGPAPHHRHCRDHPDLVHDQDAARGQHPRHHRGSLAQGARIASACGGSGNGQNAVNERAAITVIRRHIGRAAAGNPLRDPRRGSARRCCAPLRAAARGQGSARLPRGRCGRPLLPGRRRPAEGVPPKASARDLNEFTLDAATSSVSCPSSTARPSRSRWRRSRRPNC